MAAIIRCGRSARESAATACHLTIRMSCRRRIAAAATLKKRWRLAGGKPCGSPRRRPWGRSCSPRRAVALTRAPASPAGAGRAPAATPAATTRSASRRVTPAAAEATLRSVPRRATPAATSPPATRRGVVPAAAPGRAEAEAPVEAAARLPPPSAVFRIPPRRAAPWARTGARRSVALATRAAWTASTAAARVEAAAAGGAPQRSAAGDSTSATASVTRLAHRDRSRVARRRSALATRLAASDWLADEAM